MRPGGRDAAAIPGSNPCGAIPPSCNTLETSSRDDVDCCQSTAFLPRRRSPAEDGSVPLCTTVQHPLVTNGVNAKCGHPRGGMDEHQRIAIWRQRAALPQAPLHVRVCQVCQRVRLALSGVPTRSNFVHALGDGNGNRSQRVRGTPWKRAHFARTTHNNMRFNCARLVINERTVAVTTSSGMQTRQKREKCTSVRTAAQQCDNAFCKHLKLCKTRLFESVSPPSLSNVCEVPYGNNMRFVAYPSFHPSSSIPFLGRCRRPTQCFRLFSLLASS